MPCRPRFLTYSRNAAYLKFAAIAEYECLFNQIPIAWIQEAAEQSPLYEQMMRALKLDESTIEALSVAVSERLGGLEQALGKMVFVVESIDENDAPRYRQIAPVPSARVLRQLRSRILSGLGPMRLPVRRSVVGGTQPQNASRLNAQFGGANNHLCFSLPPTTPLSAIERRFFAQRSFLRQKISPPACAKKGDVHTNALPRLAREIAEFVLESLSDLDQAADYPEVVFKRAPKPSVAIENAYLQARMADEGFSRSQHETFSRHLHGHLLDRWRIEGVNVTDNLGKHSRRFVEHFVEASF